MPTLSLLLALTAGMAAPASAAPYVIPFWGEAGAYRVPGLSPSGLLFGEIVLDVDTPAADGGGLTGDYIYTGSLYSGEMRMRSYRGFELNLNVFAVIVVPKDNGFPQDEVSIQNFASESPNDWHAIFSFVKTDGSWLNGSIAQPTDVSIDFDTASLEAWFTDEYERVREFNMSVNIGAPPPNPVPLPAPLMLLSGALVPFVRLAVRRAGGDGRPSLQAQRARC